MKSEFEEQKARMEKEFAKAIAQMETQYELKLNKAASKAQLQDYKKQCGKVKHYLKDNKHNIEKEMRKISSTTKIPASLYSTADRPEHHNKAVYLELLSYFFNYVRHL